MEGKTALKYALISGSILYTYLIIHQFLDQGKTPLIHMFFSLIVFLVIIAPGLLLNLLAYRFNSRILTVLAAVSYFDSAFKFILSMLLLLIPSGLCFYAFFHIETISRKRRSR